MMDILHPMKEEELPRKEERPAARKEPSVPPPQAPAKEPARDIYKKDLGEFEKKVESFERKEIERFKQEDAARAVTTKARRKKIGVFIIILVLLGGAGLVAAQTLPRATITIVTKKSEWSYIDSIIVNKQIGSIDAVQKQIPGELFSQTRNTTVTAPASGKRFVEQKARGSVKIYNAYSSSPQRLSAGTRFSTPDNKMLYLEKALTVPGAKIMEGKIVPSVIDAVLVAPTAGTEYNLGVITKFQIPGFIGTSKYQGFYALSDGPVAGGFVGEQKFPTEEDARKAKEAARKEVRDGAEAFLALQIPANFKVIEGSKEFTVVREEVSSVADAQGNFTVYEEAQLSIMAFREDDIKALMKTLAETSLEGTQEIASYTAEYGVGRLDLRNNRMSFALSFEGAFQKPIDKEAVRQNAMGANEKELEQLIHALPNIERATISFWPKILVRSVPNDIDRVTVEIE